MRNSARNTGKQRHKHGEQRHKHEEQRQKHEEQRHKHEERRQKHGTQRERTSTDDTATSTEDSMAPGNNTAITASGAEKPKSKALTRRQLFPRPNLALIAITLDCCMNVLNCDGETANQPLSPMAVDRSR
jgi:hypothetical protein